MSTPIKEVSEKKSQRSTAHSTTPVEGARFNDLRPDALNLRNQIQSAAQYSQTTQLFKLQHLADHRSDEFNGQEPVQLRIQNSIQTRQVQNIINTDVTHKNSFESLAKRMGVLSDRINTYNRLENTMGDANKTRILKDIVVRLEGINSDLEWLLPAFSSTDRQTDIDKGAYRLLVSIEGQMHKTSHRVNSELSQRFGITRKGPGNRPDANSDAGISGSVDSNTVGLDGGQQTFMSDFVENQGGGWKEKREGLSAIWAKQQGMFTNLTPGKDNKYNADVEYKTTDVGKSELWDQKTLFYGETGFDGRISHTHNKNKDDQGKGVGILLDSTYIRKGNYEKAWLHIHKAVLNGEIKPEAIKEVKSAHPERLRSGIHVDMENKDYGVGGPEQNIKWLENQIGAKSGKYMTISAAKVNGYNLTKIHNGTVQSYGRYTNNRGWLPRGIWNEYPTSGFKNDGKCRFVINDTKTQIYLTVSHYKGYTVKHSGSERTVSRNPFVKVV